VLWDLCLSSSRTLIFLSKWSEKLWYGGTCDICPLLKQDFNCPSWVLWMTKSVMNYYCFFDSADENADYMFTVESIFLFDCWFFFFLKLNHVWSWLIFVCLICWGKEMYWMKSILHAYFIP
jgi:hypothetical protein